MQYPNNAADFCRCNEKTNRDKTSLRISGWTVSSARKSSPPEFRERSAPRRPIFHAPRAECGEVSSLIYSGGQNNGASPEKSLLLIVSNVSTRLGHSNMESMGWLDFLTDDLFSEKLSYLTRMSNLKNKIWIESPVLGLPNAMLIVLQWSMAQLQGFKVHLNF